MTFFILTSELSLVRRCTNTNGTVSGSLDGPRSGVALSVRWTSQFSGPPKSLRWTSEQKGRARYLLDTRCRQVLMHDIDLPPGQFDEPTPASVDVRRAGGSRARARAAKATEATTPHACRGPACREAHCAMRTDLPRCAQTNDEKSARRTSVSLRERRARQDLMAIRVRWCFSSHLMYSFV